MTDRKRDPLPLGYKFGDAGRPTISIRFHHVVFSSAIPPQPNDGWNVIEGERDDDPCSCARLMLDVSELSSTEAVRCAIHNRTIRRGPSGVD